VDVARVDRLERLTDLVLVLLGTSRPLSLRELADAVPGYPEAGEARRQAFERDKRTLREEGVALIAEPVPGPDQIGYRIRSEDWYLPDLDLEPDEQAALNLAVAGVHLGDPIGRDALWRLGLAGTESARPLAALPALPALPALFEAVRSRSTIEFEYRGERRHLDPAVLRFHGGRWYVVGQDLDRGAPRTFRVDRVSGSPSLYPPGSAHVPAGFDPDVALPDEPWRLGEGEPVDVEVWVDAVETPRVVAELGDRAVVERRDDASVVVRLSVSDVPALRTWVLGMAQHVEVLGPPSVRGDVVAWLTQLVAVAAGNTGAPRGRSGEPSGVASGSPVVDSTSTASTMAAPG